MSLQLFGHPFSSYGAFAHSGCLTEPAPSPERTYGLGHPSPQPFRAVLAPEQASSTWPSE